MATQRHDLRHRAAILFSLIGTIWLVSLLNVVLFDGRLTAFGILPRTEHGLLGIPFAPFLHGGVDHLVANTSGILIFGGLVMFWNKRHFWAVTVIGALVSGAGTWLVGRPAMHIGASGIVFAYFGYLLFTGIFERRFWPLLLSCLVFAVWGPTLYGVLPLQSGVSWEGHASGLLGGILSAWVLARLGGR